MFLNNGIILHQQLHFLQELEYHHQHHLLHQNQY
tara:strand:- start:401 stop:502 length:102 start_codon:yes stop_codon:yes gene_type:complete